MRVVQVRFELPYEIHKKLRQEALKKNTSLKGILGQIIEDHTQKKVQR